jgi:hypothetical protein
MAYSLWADFHQHLRQSPEVTLGAYLGHPVTLALAARDRLRAPTEADFRRDPTFDPNPHRLPFEASHEELLFGVGTLAVWGWRPLVLSAVVCSREQLAHQPVEEALAQARLEAARSAEAFLTHPSDATRSAARAAAKSCAALFAPHEDAPDSALARATWDGLGAAWFAAETSAQDYALSRWDGPPPAESSATWRRRCSVWPRRAAESAARLTSNGRVGQSIRAALCDDLAPRLTMLDVRG